MFGSHLLVVAICALREMSICFLTAVQEIRIFQAFLKRKRQVLGWNKNIKWIKMCSVVLTELPIFQTFSTATALPIRLNGSGQLLQSSDLYLQLHNLLKRRVRNTCEISKMGLLLECQICNLPSCFLFFLLGLPVVARV